MEINDITVISIVNAQKVVRQHVNLNKQVNTGNYHAVTPTKTHLHVARSQLTKCRSTSHNPWMINIRGKIN